MIRYLLLLLCVAAGAAEVQAKGFSIIRLGVERGLSNNHVVGITQDKLGFIWIATDEGLNRFDGHTFKSYFKDEQNGGGSITGNELNAILDDPRRPIVWIATQRAGLNAYNYSTDTFTSYRHDDACPTSLITDDVTSISPASDGGLWVSTFWRGIDHLDPETGVFTHYSCETVDGLERDAVWDVVDAGGGFLFAAHEHAGISVIDTNRKTARHYVNIPGDSNSIPSNDVQCIYKDSYNNIWVGTTAGLSLFNPDDGAFVNYALSHPELRHSVSDIRQFSDNKLWIAMERGGIATIEYDDGSLVSPENAVCRNLIYGFGRDFLSSPSVRTLFEDKYSNIWAGTWGGGVNLITYSVPVFRLYPSSEAVCAGEVFSQNCVFSVVFDDRRRLWVANDEGEVEVYADGSLVASYTGTPGHQAEVVQSLFKSSDGTIWIGKFFGGACRFDEKTESFEQIFPADVKADVRDMAEDANGDILLGTSSGIWRYDVRNKRLSEPANVGNNLVRKVFPMGDGTFLIGTFGAGLILTDRDFKELAHFDASSGLPSNTVNDIFRSRDGHILVATGEGLIDFPDIKSQPDSNTLYNRASGLGNSHVGGIAQDREGNVWVSTNGGISCLNKGKIYNFTSRDHVPIGNFMARSVASDHQGNLYFGAISGLCVFNPVKVFEKVDLPEPLIVEMTVMDPSVPPSESPLHIQTAGKSEVRLSSDGNSFDISFSTGNFAMADEVEYAYMLEGLDDRWIMARDENFVTFRDLPSGTYTFKVKTRVRNQEWGEPAELKIVIPPPFYLSWWAISFYVVVLVSVIWTLLYLYKRRINAEAQLQAEKEQHRKEQELNDERLRFYTNITHELRTPLTLIMGPLEDFSKEKTLSEKNRRSLSMVHRNAARLLELVNRLLEFRKTETQNRRLCVRKGNIAATVYEVALKYKELNRNPKVSISVSSESGGMEAVYDKEVVTVILDNLISNAVKYTAEGSVDVYCRKENGGIEISVKDTGRGISESALPHIFERYYQERGPHQAAGTGIGLALVKNLVALHHGIIALRSVEGKGTVFYVTLPVSDEYPEAFHTEESPHPDGAADEPETAMPVENSRKPLVLVVEDNADIRDYVKQAFTDLYDVRTAENGKIGLELAREIMPSVIVSDIMMPVMDGIEMTKLLKNDLRTSHIPIIMLTAKGSHGEREEGYLSGADSYLVKPFNSSLLQARINNLLLQRMKLQEKFSLPAAPASDGGDDSLEQKREKLMKSLNEVDKRFIEKLTMTVRDNLPSENVDVNFLSGVFCMSSSTLYRKVKALTGLSPNEFIRKIKMQMAEELLLNGNLTFSEIAFKVGMNSVAYFRSCFKEEFGMTPTEYLKRIVPSDRSV